MSVVGIGTDLVNIERIRIIWHRFGMRFARRILTSGEQQKMATLLDPVHFLAKRFAAKEAISKALGTGIGAAISFQDVSILNDAQGAPYVQYNPRVMALLQIKAINRTHISLSDEKDMALAFVLLST